MPLVLLLWLGQVSTSRAGEPPPWLPRYHLNFKLDPTKRFLEGTETVTWTNNSKVAVEKIVFNAHLRYTIDDKEIGTLAKTLEILRLAPSEAFSFDGPALEVKKNPSPRRKTSPFHRRKSHRAHGHSHRSPIFL